MFPEFLVLDKVILPRVRFEDDSRRFEIRDNFRHFSNVLVHDLGNLKRKIIVIFFGLTLSKADNKSNTVKDDLSRECVIKLVTLSDRYFLFLPSMLLNSGHKF